MAPSNGSPPSRQPRVPAWKRLGLKLKYANEDAGHNSSFSSNRGTTFASSTSTESKDQAQNDDSVFPPVSKRRRPNHVDPNQADNRHEVANLTATSPSIDEAVDVRSRESPDAAPLPVAAESVVEKQGSELTPTNDSKSRDSPHLHSQQTKAASERTQRKSVTFSTDTKQRDGSSTSDLSKQRLPEDSSSANETADPAPDFPTKKNKKRKKRASNDSSPAASSSDPSNTPDEEKQAQSQEIPACVKYLEIFYTDKSAWKFNKNKQNDLIKNLFNLDRIPAQHDQAIQSYIAGLQSPAARQRIVESAIEVLREIASKDDDFASLEDMESEEARRAAYSSALRRHLERYQSMSDNRNEHDDQEIEEMRREVERGRRAEAILSELLNNELYPDQAIGSATPSQTSSSKSSSQTTVEPNALAKGGGSTKKTVSNRKKRKARTSAPSDDSDSSLSESEADHSTNRGPATISDALKAKPDPVPTITKHSSLPKGTGTRKIFDDDFLGRVFPKKTKLS